MGSRGLSDAKALFLGSVSHKVANQATCTCVTVK
jgi:nucleotide-binding universal stress UspA family protein